MKIKICGMRNRLNIARVCALKPDMMGFIFVPNSPRFVGGNPSPDLFALPEGVEKVAVFANESTAQISECAFKYGFGTFQLHGDESPEECARLKNLGFKIIKAVGVKSPADIDFAKRYTGAADMLLLDTKTALLGGSGIKFDWRILEECSPNIPFLLGGGISPSDADAVKNIKSENFSGVDLNSRFEISPAIKDTTKLSKFIKELKK